MVESRCSNFDFIGMAGSGVVCMCQRPLGHLSYPYGLPHAWPHVVIVVSVLQPSSSCLTSRALKSWMCTCTLSSTTEDLIVHERQRLHGRAHEHSLGGVFCVYAGRSVELTLKDSKEIALLSSTSAHFLHNHTTHHHYTSVHRKVLLSCCDVVKQHSLSAILALHWSAHIW